MSVKIIQKKRIGKMLDIKDICLNKVGFFRFRELNGNVILTNDAGDYMFLKRNDFIRFISGKLKENDEVYAELSKQGFISDNMNMMRMSKKFRSKNLLLKAGTSLHIMVLTLRCNFSCLYCQTSSKKMSQHNYDMSIETAQNIIDFIFQSPSKSITIEFQGGEPTANWETLKFSVEYALKKHKKRGGNLVISLVNNGSLLTKKRLDFLIKKRVSLCFSLDGPMHLHNQHRGDNYNVVHSTLQDAIKMYKQHFPYYMPAALPTITRYSLSYAKEIVDEYVSMGLESIHLRPITSLGFAQKRFNKLTYSVEEYLQFYRKAFERIIKINKDGKIFMERYAWIFLVKILTDSDPNYLDICSPCGAGIGQMAYNYNGDIYTCDEGRMLSMMGDESFKAGNVYRQTFQDIMQSNVVKTLCVASCLEGLPECSNCAYKPYCGVCPVLNYAEKGNIFCQIPNDFRCKLHKGILDLIFEHLQDKETKEIFEQWVKII